tara:strand:+ start:488 stop:799 length:312 start_codon:yes stop_codon:yes gene_type:complete
MSNIIRLPLKPQRELFSCAFELGAGNSILKSAGLAFTHPNPNKRFIDAFLRNKLKHIGNFYHQFKKVGQTRYVISGTMIIDEKNILSFEELRDITHLADFGLD